MSKEQLIVLNRKRGAIRAQLTKIKDFINDPNPKDGIKLESKLDTLKGLQTKLSDIQNGYYEIVEDKDLPKLEQEFLDLEGDLEDIQVRIKHLIVSNIVIDNSNHTSNESNVKNINVKLPDIQLPKFNGSYHDWYNFKEQFVSLIDKNDSLSDSQKMYYLKSTLTGIAKDVITLDDSYSSLFKSLQERFQNKKLIVNSHFNEILSLDVMQDSAKHLRTLVDCIQNI